MAAAAALPPAQQRLGCGASPSSPLPDVTARSRRSCGGRDYPTKVRRRVAPRRHPSRLAASRRSSVSCTRACCLLCRVFVRGGRAAAQARPGSAANGEKTVNGLCRSSGGARQLRWIPERAVTLPGRPVPAQTGSRRPRACPASERGRRRAALPGSRGWRLRRRRPRGAPAARLSQPGAAASGAAASPGISKRGRGRPREEEAKEGGERPRTQEA
eukprot:170005-Chlamydomonas_euryale.AAC.1